MTKIINKRFALEENRITDGYRIIDLYKSESVGDFWQSGDAWIAQLNDGRARFGGYAPVMTSLKRMLARAQ